MVRNFTMENTDFPEYGFAGGNEVRAIVDNFSRMLGDSKAEVFLHASNATDGNCFYCNKRVIDYDKTTGRYQSNRANGKSDLNWDHIYPSAGFNPFVRGNVAVSCSACNGAKSATSPVDFYLEKKEKGEILRHATLVDFEDELQIITEPYRKNYSECYEFGKRMEAGDVSYREQQDRKVDMMTKANADEFRVANWSSAVYQRHVDRNFFETLINGVVQEQEAALREVFNLIAENPLPLKDIPSEEIYSSVEVVFNRRKCLTAVGSLSATTRAIKQFLLALGRDELNESLIELLGIEEFHPEYSFWTDGISDLAINNAIEVRKFRKNILNNKRKLEDISDNELILQIRETLFSIKASKSGPSITQVMKFILNKINRRTVFDAIYNANPIEELHKEYAFWSESLSSLLSVNAIAIRRFRRYILATTRKLNEISDEELINILTKFIPEINKKASSSQVLKYISMKINRKEINVFLVNYLKEDGIGYNFHINNDILIEIFNSNQLITTQSISTFAKYLFTDYKIIPKNALMATLTDFYFAETSIDLSVRVNILLKFFKHIGYNPTKSILSIDSEIASAYLELSDLIPEENKPQYNRLVDLGKMKLKVAGTYYAVFRYLYVSEKLTSLRDFTKEDYLFVKESIGTSGYVGILSELMRDCGHEWI